MEIKSNRFSSPFLEKPKLSVKHNGITIDLCLTKSTEAIVYKKNRGKKQMILDTKDHDVLRGFTDYDVKFGETYEYSVVPYFTANGETVFGTEIALEKIKFYGFTEDDFWWIEI